MILLNTVPYLRRKTRFTVADRYGSWVAHQDIVRAALQYGVVEGVHFFLPFFRDYSKADIPGAIEELRTDFPGRPIEVKRVSELHDLARTMQYVLADDFEGFTALAASRYADGRCLFPVATVVHTIPRQIALLGYLGVFVLADPFDAIIATSTAAQRTLRTIFEDIATFVNGRLGSTVSGEMPVRRIPLAVDDTFLVPRHRQAARRELELPVDPPIMMYLGRLSETFKADLEPLLHTLRRLRVHDPSLVLVIAGQDTENRYTSTLRSLAGAYGVAESVIVRPNFPYAEKPLLYASCDVFVSPVDNIQETFGLSILEAMAAGVPVVASDWSGYRDLVAHGESGFLARTVWNAGASRVAERVAAFPVRSEFFLAQQTVVDGEDLYRYLKLLVDSPDLRVRFGARGRQRVSETFSWRVVINQYADLWKEQWSGLRRRAAVSRPGLPLNIQRQFGHFATAALDRTMVFTPSVHGDGRASLQDIDRSNIPYPLEWNDIRRVMAACSGTPLSLENLESDTRDATASAVTWLWKKGYLEPVGVGAAEEANALDLGTKAACVR